MGTVADYSTPATSRLQEQLTTRLPLVWFSLAFLAGIVLANLVPLHILVWIALVFLSVVLVIVSQILGTRLKHTIHPSREAFILSLFSFLLQPFAFILLFALFLGAARYQASVPKFDAFHIAFYNDRDYDLLITGTLVEPPDYRDNYTNLRVEVSSVNTGDR